MTVAPRVRWHTLVASDYAATMINVLYPGDLRNVKEERETQIKRMKSI